MRSIGALVGMGGLALTVVGCRGEATDTREGTTKGQLVTSTASGSSSTTTQWTAGDDNVLAPTWSGNSAKGSLFMPLYRGSAPGLEDNIYTPDDRDCSKFHGTARYEWDQSANAVTITLKGKGFPPHPMIHRTEGVDWWPNPFHNAPKDLTNAGYRLWTILVALTRTAHFYYDPNTLHLMGSEFDFASPPQPSITLDFPVFAIIDSVIIHPDESGNVFHQYTVAYDHFTVEDKKFSLMWVTFIPHDLCEAAPFQPNISQLRPYVSPWQSVDQAPSWDQMLRRSLAVDVQVEDATPQAPELGAQLPYGYGGTSFISNIPAVQGGVPNGGHFSIVGAIQSVPPAFDFVPGGNGLGCKPWISEPHVSAPRYCEGGAQ